MTTPPLSSMRGDISGLITDWGVSCTVKRKAAGFDPAGRNSGTFATSSTQELWIQPVGMDSDSRMPEGVEEGSTHLAVQRQGGASIKKEDRILESGNAFEYDVVGTHEWPTHTSVFLKLNKRT
jgi:hypothetical protein